MAEIHYMISDASKKLGVEAHVLRYWEEELEIEIPRNELGHRFYTDYHLLIFERILLLKNAGYQLKAIKLLIPKLAAFDTEEISFLCLVPDEMNRRAYELFGEEASRSSSAGEAPSAAASASADIIPITSCTPAENPSEAQAFANPISSERLFQFQQLMSGILSSSFRQQMLLFQDTLTQQLSTHLSNELNTLFKLQEEQQKLHFKQLDDTLREHQKVMQEAAASRFPGRKKRH